MKVIPLNCNHCGAPLEVPAKARFVTCGFCEAKLTIEHSGNTYSTAVLEEIKETTEQLARDVAEIKSNTDLDQLDAQWDRIRARHMVQGKHGASLPTRTGAIMVGLIGGGFGLVWTVIAFGITSGGVAMGMPGFVMVFPLFGVLVIAAAIVGAVVTFNKAEAYERDLRKYQNERRQMTSQSSGG